MNVSELINEINDLSDDQIPENQVTAFINDALAHIGGEINATFPEVVSENDEPVIPVKWQKLLIVPFGKGRVKEKDSSQFEWESGYNQFYLNLDKFKVDYRPPKIYRDIKQGETITTENGDYTSDSGDTIYLIAQEIGTDPNSLMALNDDVLFENDLYNKTSSSSFSPNFWNFPW